MAVTSDRPGKREAPPAPEPLAPLIDAHTHLDACGARDAEGVVAIVDRAAAVGVGAVVTIAATRNTYDVPLVRPVMVWLVAVELNVRDARTVEPATGVTT